jgi:uncharacterized membrane protein YedE/YeeE
MLAPSILTLLVGGLLGLAFGAVARWSAFCVRGAIEDVVSGERLSPRVSAYLVALAVSLVGVQALVLAGLLDAGQVIHLPSGLSLGGTILGGLMFGVGMVLAGGCGARQLVLAGGGNLRSLSVLVIFALVAYASMRGILSPLRAAIAGDTIVPMAASGREASLATLGAGALAIDATILRLILAAIVTVIAAAVVVRRPSLRGIVGGGGIGLLVVAGFLGTALLLADEFNPRPAESLSVTRGVGDSLVYLLTWTGATIDFAIAFTFGVPIGAAAVALLRGEAALAGFSSAPQMLRYATGGALMGAGGVLAAGCTIGNGLTGLAVLGPSALVAFAAIVAGAVATMLWQRRSAMPSAGTASVA